MRILILEDDEQLTQHIGRGMSEAGYTVLQSCNGIDGLDLALNEGFDIAIIDIMLPGMDGLSIVRRMRAENITTPVIIISARRSVNDKVSGLHSGGDDYLIKPFAFTELLARVEALLRRVNDIGLGPTIHELDLEVNLVSRRVTRSGQVICLSPKEYALLEYLLKNSGQIVSRTMIMERVWNYNFDPNTNVIEAHISKLREKIDKGFDTPLIHTVRGAGYMLQADSVHTRTSPKSYPKGSNW